MQQQLLWDCDWPRHAQAHICECLQEAPLHSAVSITPSDNRGKTAWASAAPRALLLQSASGEDGSGNHTCLFGERLTRAGSAELLLPNSEAARRAFSCGMTGVSTAFAWLCALALPAHNRPC